jgi:hypothetical protein
MIWFLSDRAPAFSETAGGDYSTRATPALSPSQGRQGTHAIGDDEHASLTSEPHDGMARRGVVRVFLVNDRIEA